MRADRKRETLVPPFAFCERTTATPTSPVHIRRVGPEGLKFGGGAPDTTLCGRPLGHGWDTQLAVDADSVTRLAELPADRPGRVCKDCAAIWLNPGARYMATVGKAPTPSAERTERLRMRQPRATPAGHGAAAHHPRTRP